MMSSMGVIENDKYFKTSFMNSDERICLEICLQARLTYLIQWISLNWEKFETHNLTSFMNAPVLWPVLKEYPYY